MCRSKAEGGRRCPAGRTGCPQSLWIVQAALRRRVVRPHAAQPGGGSRAAQKQLGDDPRRWSWMPRSLTRPRRWGRWPTLTRPARSRMRSRPRSRRTAARAAAGKSPAVRRSRRGGPGDESQRGPGQDRGNRGVTAALTACGCRLAAGLAGRAAADMLMKLTPVRHWEDLRRAVQLLAVSLCPDVADHPEVEQYCLRPLASEMLSSAIQEELAESLPGDRSLSAG